MPVCAVNNRLVTRLSVRINFIVPWLVKHGCACYTGTGYFLYSTFFMNQFGV